MGERGVQRQNGRNRRRRAGFEALKVSCWQVCLGSIVCKYNATAEHPSKQGPGTGASEVWMVSLPQTSLASGRFSIPCPSLASVSEHPSCLHKEPGDTPARYIVKSLASSAVPLFKPLSSSLSLHFLLETMISKS